MWGEVGGEKHLRQLVSFPVFSGFCHVGERVTRTIDLLHAALPTPDIVHCRKHILGLLHGKLSK